MKLLSRIFSSVKMTLLLTIATIACQKICDKPFLAAMRAQLIHYLDTSCKWGTHVLRFFWRTHRNFRDVELLFYP